MTYIDDSKFADFVGQEEAKTVISTLIKASKLKDEAIPHMAFSGNPGTGKTTLAQLSADFIDSKLFTVNCSTVGSFKDIRLILNKISFQDVLFLDEIHALRKKVCESLYTIMEGFYYNNDNGYKINLPEFTIIGATTDFGKLPQPLRDRFKFKAVFREYSLEELTKICHLVCKNKGFKLSEKLANTIAKTCRNTPRHVVSRTEWIYSYMVANNLKKISTEKVLEVIGLQGFNQDGLERNDIKYLEILKDVESMGLNQISYRLGVSDEDVKHTIEPFLIKLNLIQIGTSGRSLTREGFKYVK
jgi:Holliday junction DNA helicase RuvB